MSIDPQQLDAAQEHLGALISAVDVLGGSINALDGSLPRPVDEPSLADDFGPEQTGHVLAFAHDVRSAMSRLDSDLEHVERRAAQLYYATRDEAA